MTRPGRRALELVAVALLAAGCAGAAPPPPPPSPTAVVARIESPSDLVLVDGRRVHVPRMNGSDPLTACQDGADRALAERLVGGGQTIRVTRPRANDSPSSVPTGYVQADVTSPSAGNYADAFYGQQSAARNTACPLVPTTLPEVSEEPSSNGDVDVDVDRDGGGESRLCRGRWYC